MIYRHVKHMCFMYVYTKHVPLYSTINLLYIRWCIQYAMDYVQSWNKLLLQFG